MVNNNPSYWNLCMTSSCLVLRKTIQELFYERFFNELKEEERREFVRACDEMKRRAMWYINSNEAGFSRKEDVRKTLNEMQMITDVNKKYLK